VKLFHLFFITLLLSACQPSEEAKKSETAAKQSEQSPEASAENEHDSSHNHDHDHTQNQKPILSPLLEQPYEVVESDQACSEPVVIEFFAYQCPHCYTLEKHSQAWQEKNNGKVKFLSIPTHLGNQQFGSFILVHEAARTLGILNKVTPLLFKRLHEEKKLFSSQDEAIDFLVSAGANKERATKAIGDEEAIKTAIDNNFGLLAKYKVSGVPTILVNHRYKFNVTKAGGYDKVFEVVDQTLKLPSNCNGQ